MKRTKLIVGIFFIFFVLIYSYNNFFSKKMLTGTYVNINYENSPAVETAKRTDTLYIYEDNSFYSRYYGKGTYHLSYSFSGTKIDMSYKSSGRNTFIKRDWFGKPKIILFRDINHFYIKQ